MERDPADATGDNTRYPYESIEDNMDASGVSGCDEDAAERPMKRRNASEHVSECSEQTGREDSPGRAQDELHDPSSKMAVPDGSYTYDVPRPPMVQESVGPGDSAAHFPQTTRDYNAKIPLEVTVVQLSEMCACCTFTSVIITGL